MYKMSYQKLLGEFDTVSAPITEINVIYTKPNLKIHGTSKMNSISETANNLATGTGSATITTAMFNSCHGRHNAYRHKCSDMNHQSRNCLVTGYLEQSTTESINKRRK